MQIALVCLAAILGQVPDEPIKRLHTPQDGLALAYGDAINISQGNDPKCLPAELPFQRYVWVPPRLNADLIDDIRAVSGCLHYASRSSQAGSHTRPVVKGSVLRVDLRRDARARNFALADLTDWLREWEKFAFDPYFATIVTADQIKGGAQVELPTVKQHKVEWSWDASAKGTWTDADGKVYRGQWVKKNVVTEGTVKDFAGAVRLDGLHVDQEAWRNLCALLHTQAPVVHAGTFISRALTTIDGTTPLYRLIYSGIYFELKGIPKADKNIKGDNDELALYRSLGVDTRGKTLDQFFEEISGDRKIGLFFSKVSGRARQVIMINNLVDPDDPAVYITRDTLAENIDISGHAMANLLDFKHEATEVIFVRGFPGFALYDGKGNLVRFGDINAVSDGEIPKPYRPVLESGIGCIRCHRYEQGYRPAPNHVQQLAPAGDAGRFGKDAHDKHLRETRDRIVELYQGNSKSRLDRSRNRLNEVVLLATGPWKGSKDQTDVAGLLGKQLADIVHEYKYELVTPELACRDLGFVPPDGKALALLEVLLKRDDTDAKYLTATIGFVPEDFRLAGLLAGIPITRTDWQLSYSYAAARAQRNWAEIEAKARKK